MKSSPRWVEAIQWALVLAMFALGALTWPVAPDHIPVHWTIAGQVDRYGGKLEGLFLLPAITLLIVLALRYLPLIDPKGIRYAEFAGAYTVIRLVVTGVLAGIYGLILLSARGVEVSVGRIVPLLLGLLLVVLGAVLDQVRSNWFVGIRTPWTLSSERSWTATHRAGKWVFMALGVAVALAGVVQAAWAFAAALVMVIVGIVGLLVYSYVVWRQDARGHAL